MTIISRLLFTSLLSLFLASLLPGQNTFQIIQPVEEVINARQYRDGSNEKQIFTSLSINNIKNLYQVSIYLNADLLVSVKKDNGNHLFAYVRMLHIELSEDTRFRDFAIDTLLTPKAFDGYLHIYQNGVRIAHLPMEMLLSGGVLDLESIDHKISDPDKISANVEISRFYFDDHQVQQFMQLANSINSYYSYNEVLNHLLHTYSGALNRGLSSAETFIAWHEINRAMMALEKHHFTTELHLEQNDPASLLPKVKRMNSLWQRASTLFTIELKKGRKGRLIDRDKYSREYVGISLKYIKMSKDFPPNMTSAFNELVHIFPIKEDLNRMSNVASFYDLFRITGSASTTQRVYNYFVEAASDKLNEGDYLDAMALIRNATTLESFFSNIIASEEVTDIYVQSLDGLLSSFLQVSVMAYKARNFKMARRYYLNAQSIYEENKESLGKVLAVENSFKRYVDKQIELADLLLNDHAFDEAITLLEETENTIEEHELNVNRTALATKYKKGYSGLYETLVDSVAYYITKEKNENSLSMILYTAGFEQDHAKYIDRDERIITYAYILYRNLFDQALKELGGGNAEDALGLLLEADQIDETILKQHYAQTDSLIRLAAIPVIKEMIRSAEFEVWANRLENAEKMKEQAVAWQIKYKLSENGEVCDAIASLNNKIRHRNCVGLQYKTDHAEQIIQHRMDTGKIGEAQEKMQEIYTLIHDNPSCEINKTGLDSLRKAYNPLFDYMKLLDALEKKISGLTFDVIFQQYQALTDEFYTNGLDRYVQPPPELQNMLMKDANEKAIRDATYHYINTGDYQTAFSLLEILKDKGVSAKETKILQQKTGEGLCYGKDDKKAWIIQFTKNNPYYRALRTACLKN